MTSLNIEDVNLNTLECIVIGKGDKQRIVYIDEITAMFLKQYLAERTDDNPALFVGQRKERLQPNGVRALLKALAEKTGINHVYPHKFRRTRITEFVKRGMPIEQVKELAGHDKIDTTMGYVVMDKTQVKNAYRKYT